MARESALWKDAAVLLVEDDAGDRELVRRAMRDDGFRAELYVVEDGQEALEYLLHNGIYAETNRAPRPNLILLDLNLPGIGGKQVLEEIKNSKELCETPIVVFTTSARQIDIEDSYRLGCNSYVIKPLEADRFIAVLRELMVYWFGLVTLPVK